MFVLDGVVGKALIELFYIMREQISFFVLSNSGALRKQVTVSRPFFSFFCLLITAGLVFAGFVIYDYSILKKTLFNNRELKSLTAAQLDEIVSQRKQIQRFAREINGLKSSLAALNKLEKKVRVIANIEKKGDQNSFFGIGGSMPEDLDTKLALTEKHNDLLREMHDQSGQLNLALSNQKQGFESLLNSLEERDNLLAATPSIRPTNGWVTSKFGYRKSPYAGLREFHRGLDIANREGTSVKAAADGIIKFCGLKGFLGKALVIDHGHGMATRYGHLQKILKRRGDAVKRGDIIGYLGSTGRSTGPHLHYEVFLNGIPVNPEKYILN